jgi:hypothetical protein
MIIFKTEIQQNTQIIIQHKTNDNNFEINNLQIDLFLTQKVPFNSQISPNAHQIKENVISWRTGLLKKAQKGFIMV